MPSNSCQWKEVTRRKSRKACDQRLNKDVDEFYDTCDYQTAWTRRPANVQTFHKHRAREKKENHEIAVRKAAMFTPNPVRLGAGEGLHPPHKKRRISARRGPPHGCKRECKIRASLTARSAAKPALTRALKAGMLVHALDNVAYFGKAPNSPQVGDVRPVFTWIPPEKEFSLIARVHGSVLEDVTTPDGRSLGGLNSGKHSAEELLA